jgi:Tol biopolymer transport system component
MRTHSIGLGVVGLCLVWGSVAEASICTRASVATDGAQGYNQSWDASLSGDGRYVAFESLASTLVPHDTNASCDVFVHDCQTGETTRVSVSSAGGQGDLSSYNPSISADGRYVAFESVADNLVAGDTNGCADVFRRDRQTGQTIRVSVKSDGAQGHQASGAPAITADGGLVAFESWAGNLVPDDTNHSSDVFVHNCKTGNTRRVSVSSNGAQGDWDSLMASVSADGRLVAFMSLAANLVPGDTNDFQDVFVHDRQTGQTTRVSVASGGVQGNGDSEHLSISANGRFVAFEATSTNLVANDTNGVWDVFVHDRQTGQTTRVSVASNGAQATEWSADPSISADGRYVAFYSWAANLVAGDTNGLPDIFRHDRQTAQTIRVSLAHDGSQSNGESRWPCIAADGRQVAFESEASHLVPGDTNTCWDVFVVRVAAQPDMLIRSSGAAKFRGGNTYNETGVGQTQAQTVAVGAAAVYYLRMQNDGCPPDRFTIGGPGGGSIWSVRYFYQADIAWVEITNAVTGAGWTGPQLLPGAYRTLRLDVKPKPGAAGGASKTVLVTATSQADATSKDAVKAVTTVAGDLSPGALANVTAIAARNGVEIALSLSGPAAVDARILNPAGRPVRVLCRARPCEEGVTRLLWDGRSSSGLALPDGSYLVEVSARTPDGTQARAVTVLRLTR